MATKTVLLIGARGFLGNQVLEAALKSDKKYKVKALIRPGSNFTVDNVEMVRGDMMDKESLLTAFQGVDAVICTANGYMSGHTEIDTVGANNLVDAVKATGVKRYIYCSVLTAEKAVGVEHFEHKKMAEDYMKEQDIPFVALRPGGFIDQADDYLGAGLKRGDPFCVSMWDKTVKIGMIYTPDLAELFVKAIEIPKDKCSIDVGWSRPVSMQEVASIISAKVDRKIYCLGLPRFLRYAMIYTLGYWKPFVGELMKMFNYFDTGSYVNTTDLQTKYFGPPPSPEEVLGRYVDNLMREKAEADTAT